MNAALSFVRGKNISFLPKMTRKCVIAGCKTKAGMGYSLHGFPRVEAIRAQWISAVKRNRKDWDAPTSDSLVCSKHFQPECFIIDGSRFRDSMGLPMKKKLRSDAIPTIFPKTEHGSICHPSTPPPRPAVEKRRRQEVK